ncbi:MAG: universal stress protein [Candidatus Promineifilaceae bacterium]
MYKKILVPLDGSPRAEAILPHVEDLASCFGATIVFVRIVEPNIVYASPYDVSPELNAEEAERRIEEVNAYLIEVEERFQAKGIATKRRVEYGPVVLAISDVAAGEEVDLIAMASHGRTGLARVFYGSVAAGILHRVDRPVLLVRSQ